MQARWLAVAAAGFALTIPVAVVVNEDRSSGLAPPADTWRHESVPPGRAALALRTPQGDDCGQTMTSVAGTGQTAHVSYACYPPAGDESAPVPDPGYAVDRLLPNGVVERLPPADDRRSPVKVEHVGADGTVWALQRGVVRTRPPGGAWTADVGATSNVLDDVVDLEFTADGSVYELRRYRVSVQPARGPARVLVEDRARAETTSTYYLDDNGGPPTDLPTLTGLTVLDDGTVVLLATDSVLVLEGDGSLRKVVTPRTSGDDPRTRLGRSAVRDGGTGSYLISPIPCGRDVLVYDQRAGRILRISLDGSIRHVAGRPASRIGGPESGVVTGSGWQQGEIGVEDVHLGIGGTFEPSLGMALLDDDQLLVATSHDGLVRIGLREPC